MILTVLLAGHLCRTWRLISLSKLDASIGVEMIEDGLLLRDIDGIHPLLICHLLFVLRIGRHHVRLIRLGFTQSPTCKISHVDRFCCIHTECYFVVIDPFVSNVTDLCVLVLGEPTFVSGPFHFELFLLHPLNNSLAQNAS